MKLKITVQRTRKRFSTQAPRYGVGFAVAAVLLILFQAPLLAIGAVFAMALVLMVVARK